MLNASAFLHLDAHQTHAYICVYDRHILCKGLLTNQQRSNSSTSSVSSLSIYIQNRHMTHANKATDERAALNIKSALYSHVSFNLHPDQRVMQNRHANMQRGLLLNARRLGSPTICTTTSLFMSLQNRRAQAEA